jgi:uncharacterized protein (TIGR02271 family)
MDMQTNPVAEDANENTSSIVQTSDEKIVVPVIEEQAIISKQVVQTGKVRISKRVSQHEELIDEPLLREEVTIERVPINQYVEQTPQVRHEGDVMIIPVVQEQIVMQKRLVLVEELRVRKQIVETHQPQSVSLRKETVDVIRFAETENSGSQNKG